MDRQLDPPCPPRLRGENQREKVRQFIVGLAGGGGGGLPVTMTAAPFCSLTWPAATTWSPGLTPSRIATLPSQRGPVLTGVRNAFSTGLPSGAVPSCWTT